MHPILLSFNWGNLINPDFYIAHGGLWILLFIIFAETGLFIGFFLPGDSLLFVAGFYSTKLAAYIHDFNSDFLNLLLLCTLFVIAGILGNTFGYFFGKKIGPLMYNWKDRFWYKKKYLYDAHDFFEKHGVLTVVFARFVPFIRPFAPIVAGIVDMNKKHFAVLNIIGCIAWVFSMVFAGHYLEQFCLAKFNFDLEKHLDLIVIGIVLITTAPVLLKIFLSRKKTSTQNV